MEFDRLNEALDEAVVHLEERASEEKSVVSCSSQLQLKLKQQRLKHTLESKRKLQRQSCKRLKIRQSCKGNC